MAYNGFAAAIVGLSLPPSLVRPPWKLSLDQIEGQAWFRWVGRLDKPCSIPRVGVWGRLSPEFRFGLSVFLISIQLVILSNFNYVNYIQFLVRLLLMKYLILYVEIVFCFGLAFHFSKKHYERINFHFLYFRKTIFMIKWITNLLGDGFFFVLLFLSFHNSYLFATNGYLAFLRFVIIKLVDEIDKVKNINQLGLNVDIS